MSVEEFGESLSLIYSGYGMDVFKLFFSAKRCFRFSKKFEEVLEKRCYDNVKNGNEAKRVINSNSDSDYKELLNKELTEINESELWKTLEILKKLRGLIIFF